MLTYWRHTPSGSLVGLEKPVTPLHTHTHTHTPQDYLEEVLAEHLKMQLNLGDSDNASHGFDG